MLQGTDSRETLVVAVVVNERYTCLLGRSADQEINWWNTAVLPGSGQQGL
ncbi:MAG TPA: hypothetical protein VGF15_05275 [Solirubrobacteraceae bacterium]|jgi:hypothetical protein